MNNTRFSIYYTILGFIIVASMLLFPIATRNQAPSEAAIISVVTGESEADEEDDDDNDAFGLFERDQDRRGGRDGR